MDSEVVMNIAKNPKKTVDSHCAGTTVKIISIKPFSEELKDCIEMAITAIIRIIIDKIM